MRRRTWGYGQQSRGGESGFTRENRGSLAGRKRAHTGAENRRYTPCTMGCTGFEGRKINVEKRESRENADRETDGVNVRTLRTRLLVARDKRITAWEHRRDTDSEGVLVHPRCVGDEYTRAGIGRGCTPLKAAGVTAESRASKKGDGCRTPAETEQGVPARNTTNPVTRDGNEQ